MRRWWEKVDFVIGSIASSMTWAHHDSPLLATKYTAASRFGSASAARIRGSWMSSAAGSTTSSITLLSIGQVASSSMVIVLFDDCRTSMDVEQLAVKGEENSGQRGIEAGEPADWCPRGAGPDRAAAALAHAARRAHRPVHGRVRPVGGERSGAVTAAQPARQRCGPAVDRRRVRVHV